MIDLHTHTDASDGSLPAVQLITAAAGLGLEALAITDHDTFRGYDDGAECAATLGLDLICGIELSAKYRGRSVHLLGYFLNGGPSEEFRGWINGLQTSRRIRNQQLAASLQAKGFEITLDEVRELGRGMAGRPHFAALMVSKGYVSSIQQAFDEYLDESAACYVPREEPAFAPAVGRIVDGGGVPSLPHPGRFSRNRELLEESVGDMRSSGLRGLEVYHSEHTETDIDFYGSLARRYSLAATGGSDFHGANKPGVALGTGNVPRSVLENLRRLR